MYAIEINKLVKFYGPLKAVDNLDLKIEEGEFFGLLGPNGAGKTTTINSICGLVKFKGEIKVFDKDVVKEYLDTRCTIGLSQQEINLDNFFTIEKVLYYQGGFYGLSGQDLQRRIDELISQFKLQDKRRDWITKLSGGMKRKVMVAKALIHNPKILILDEPTAGVDVQSRHELWDYLTNLNKKNGVTIILTSHYIEEVKHLCDRVAIIGEGKLKALDNISNLEKKYKNNLEEIFLKLT